MKHFVNLSNVLNRLNEFSGYTHVMVMGSGAELICDAIKNTQTRDERFFKTNNSQYERCKKTR